MINETGQSDLAACLENALDNRQLEDASLHQAIRALLNRSVEYGRAGRVLGDDFDKTSCQEYVEQVILYYDEYHPLITRLKNGDPETWSKLTRQVKVWAYSYLKKQNIYGNLLERCINECVPNAVLAYFSSAYHYDADFYAWFCVLVQNVCRKHINNQQHPNRINENQALSYDKFSNLIEALADNDAIHSQRLKELRMMLLDAIEKLSSEARKELIIRYYFSGYSFKEIAAEMNRTLNATYKLHFDALKDLKGNLSDQD